MARSYETPFRAIGARISDARRALSRRSDSRVTQRQVAERVGVHEGTVTAWETGKQVPEGENLRKLAEVLGVEADWLVEGSSDRVSEPGGTYQSMKLREESPEQAMAGNRPSVSLLKPKALAYYYATLSEWAEKWTSETLDAAARDWTSFLRGDSILSSSGPGRPDLTEERQLKSLKAMRPIIEESYEHPGDGRS